MMKKTFALLFCMLLLSSCHEMFNWESSEEKQEKIEVQKQKEKQEKQEREIKEKKEKGKKQERIRKRKKEEREKYNEMERQKKALLSDDINDKSGRLNESANKLLFSKVVINKEYDFESDDSILKFVNNKVSFTNKEYIPNGLVDLKGRYLEDVKGHSQLKEEALHKLRRLSEDFFLKFGKKLKVVSAYRSYKKQESIKARGCSDVFCAKAGYSEHQSGLVVDLWETKNEQKFLSKKNLRNYFLWMNQEAHKYGFTNTYSKGVKEDGYEKEPWHWRYVGVEFAGTLRDNRMSFAQFVEQVQQGTE